MRALVQADRKVYWIVALLSLLLSASLSLQQDIVNPDAICYLLSAQQVGQAGVSAAMHLCGQAAWPFYSVLIYAFSTLSSLSFATSAHLLNGLFTLITVLAFIALVEKLGGKGRVLWLAAFVILTAHQFNSVRDYIVRDHGFWAFYLVSMLFLLRFLQKNNWLNAIGFGASLALAALFRIEGAVFLALLPLLVWFQSAKSWRTCFIDYCKLNITGFIALVALGVWVLTHAPSTYEKLGRLPELLNQLRDGLTVMAGQYEVAKATLVQYLLPNEAERDAGLVWVSVMVVLFCWNIITNLSWVASLLLVYAVCAGVISSFKPSGRLALFGYLIVNLLIAAPFFAERMFFSKRYLIALVLVLLLILPFALDRLISSPHVRNRMAGYVAMALLFISTLGVVFHLSASKNYIRAAGAWMASNIPDKAALYTNDMQLAYYSTHFGNAIFETMRAQLRRAPEWQTYDYVALRINRKHAARLTAFADSVHGNVLQRFTNSNGDQVIVYQIPHMAEARGVQ